MKLDIIDHLKDLISFKNEYESLFCQTPDATPFQNFAWIYNYLKYFQGTNIPHIIHISEKDNLVAIFPMQIKDYLGIKAIDFIGTRGTDYLNFIIKEKYKRECIRSFLEHFIRTYYIDLIYLEDIIETDDAIECLETESRELGLMFHIIFC